MVPALPLFYCDHYPFPLPSGHKFPLSKYRLLRDRLTFDLRFEIRPARLATRDEVLEIHERSYVDAFLEGTLPAPVMRRIGFPWSPELVTRTLASAGSTLSAVEAALRGGFGGSLAGGTHHAYRNEGSGFCVFNDLAIAIAWARQHHQLERIAVVDLDVHQGDGTASIFAGDPAVFTLSLHGDRNFPLRKQHSTLDVPLADNTGDRDYMEALASALHHVRAFHPQLVLYQSGVDSLKTDKLGRLHLTPDGLAARDQAVIKYAHAAGIPIAVTIGGGYSEPIDLTVAANASTYQTAASIYCGGGAAPNVK